MTKVSMGKRLIGLCLVLACIYSLFIKFGLIQRIWIINLSLVTGSYLSYLSYEGMPDKNNGVE